jgi:hypothetical protein
MSTERSWSDGWDAKNVPTFLAWIRATDAFGAILAGVLAGPALSLLAWIPMVAVVLALGCCMATDRSAS